MNHVRTLHYIKFRVEKCISTSVTLQITENLNKNKSKLWKGRQEQMGNLASM